MLRSTPPALPACSRRPRSARSRNGATSRYCAMPHPARSAPAFESASFWPIDAGSFSAAARAASALRRGLALRRRFALRRSLTLQRSLTLRRRLTLQPRLAFTLFAFRNFLAVDGDVAGRLDADANLGAVHRHHGHLNIVANAQTLTGAASEYQHVEAPAG